MSALRIVEMPDKPLSMNPKKFALWLFMASVMMMFASLTSAYIVRRGDGNWRIFDLPDMFWITTAVIVISSISMHVAMMAAKRDNMTVLKGSIILTTILGIGFLYGQFNAWGDLVGANVYFSGGNPSESFIYVLTGVHFLHIVSAIIFLLIVVTNVFRFQVHSKKMAQIQMCATYWHFLDALWVYLFVFLLFNHQ